MIFPAHLPLLHGPELTAPLAAWAAERVPHVGPDGFGPSWAVGVVRGDDLAAVVVYHDYVPSYGTVGLSIASVTPRWATREVIAELIAAPFRGALGAPVRKLWALCSIHNKRACRMNERIGFIQEAVLREHFAPREHGVVFRMMHSEWRRRYRQ